MISNGMRDFVTTTEPLRSHNLNPEVEVIQNIKNVKVYIGGHKAMERTPDDTYKEVSLIVDKSYKLITYILSHSVIQGTHS